MLSKNITDRYDKKKNTIFPGNMEFKELLDSIKK